MQNYQFGDDSRDVRQQRVVFVARNVASRRRSRRRFVSGNWRPDMAFQPATGQTRPDDDVLNDLARHILRILCKNDSGRARLGADVVQNFRQQLAGQVIPAGHGDVVDVLFNRNRHLFRRVASSGDDVEVVASLVLRVCRWFNTKDGCRDERCGHFHCCKLSVTTGDCKYGPHCRYGHDILADSHNAPLLRRFLLDGMSSDDVARLLRAEMTTPKLCKYYNSPSGCRCDQDGKRCPALHVCRHYVIGDCTYGAGCRRSHDITGPNVVAILRRCGVDVGGRDVEDVRAELSSLIATNDNDVTDSSSSNSSSSSRPSTSESSSRSADSSRTQNVRPHTSSAGKRTRDRDDSTLLASDATIRPSTSRFRKGTPRSADGTRRGRQRICIYRLRGNCRYGDGCQNYHSAFGLPYQWQWRELGSTAGTQAAAYDDRWEDFGKDACTTIERNFCDVAKEAVDVQDENGDHVLIDFSNKTYLRTRDGDTGTVRRLGTHSALNAETYSRQRFKTLWKWYWKTLAGNWEVYDVSDDIEQEQQSENSSYVSPGNDFKIDLRSMVHQNVNGGNQFPVRRRPVFFDISSTMLLATSGFAESRTNFPASWRFDVTGNGDPDFQLVPVPSSGSTAKEYQEIAALFGVTMPGPIKSLKRIQNKELWEDFDRTRQRMEKKRSGKGPLTVRRLFHGTKSQYADAICQQGFDWRVAGMSVGTMFGKGSYFARDAIYSRDYCCSSKRMFVVQVIVGDFTFGKPDYVRPPAKDPSLPLADQQMYDTCVNDMSNPAIFVVFDRSQVYPEYLIEF